jgi:hypothetical protein
MPTYLYHATSAETAKLIANKDSGTGLKAMSGAKDQEKYLCMSGTEKGAVTLNSRANDVIFRVKFSDLDEKKWTKTGAGKEEWRGTQSIDKGLLEYRRNLGTPKNPATWRPTSFFPLGTA